jgi:predicted nuclease of predicted toxin-antitoxin system
VTVFLIDEDMPRSTARVLRDAGYEATDVRDIGLMGHKDPVIFARAQAMDATLVTADREFANLLLFPLGSHAGIIVTRTPNRMSIQQLHEMLLAALENLRGHDLHGTLVVVEPGRTRLRQPGSA